MRRITVLPAALLAVLPVLPVGAETIRFEFSGVVEASNFSLPDAGTAYSAFALFDTDVEPEAPDVFGRRNFLGALTAFEATVGGETVTLNQAATAQQSGADLVSGIFGRGGTLISPGVDALDGSIGGLEALYGNFEVASFPGEPDFFTDIAELLSGIDEDGLSFDRTSFDTFELTFDNPGVFGDGFIIADIAEGAFLFADDGDGGPGGGGGGGTGGGGTGGGETPAPIPLPAGGALLLTALPLLGARHRLRA